MAKNQFRSDININSIVENKDGCIGRVIGHGQFVGQVNVDYAFGSRSESISDIKLSGLTTETLSKARKMGPEMFVAIKNLMAALPVMNKNRYQYRECQRIIEILDTIENNSH